MDEFPSASPALSLALIGLESAAIGADPRAQIAWAGETGFGAVQLDATAPSVRPRELDRSARRDLASTMRRAGLASSGVDLFIPPAHLLDPAHADRAIAAMLGAIELAAQLADLTGGVPVLSTRLPHEAGARTAIDTLAEHALAHGVRVADHAWPPDESIPGASPIGVGLDPASMFLADPEADPAAAASRLGERVAGARLADLDADGRAAPGDGRLDELAYAVALSTGAYAGRLVLDLRGLARQASVARAVLERLGGPGGSSRPSR
jgi:sugar phosphate isomerase/epimerase